MVMTTSCNPCFFATSSCDYSFRKNYPINSDDEYYVKNNTSKETRIADLRYCISYACPEVYQKYQLPDENGDYREIIRRKYKDDYNLIITFSYLKKKVFQEMIRNWLIMQLEICTLFV